MTGSRQVSRDIVGVLGTRAAWTLMSMISGIILARMLGPHDRGILALAILLPSTVITVAKFGITQANVYFINRMKVPASQVASNSAGLAVVLSAIAVAATWLLRDVLSSSVLRGVETWALALALWRVPWLLLDDYLYGVLQATGNFALYNTRLIIGEALRSILVIVGVLVFNMGLKAAVVIYSFVTTINVGWVILSTRRIIPFGLNLDWKLLGQQLTFGAKSYIQTLTSHLLLRVDIYMVAYYLGPADTAFYALALRFTEMLLEVPQAVGLVLYPKLAALQEAEVHRLTAQACRRTLLITGVSVLVLTLVGPYLITLWYGQDYAPAGAPLPWASVGVLMMSIFVILTRAFTSQNRQQVNISAGLLALISNVALNVFMIPEFGIVGAAMATAISYSAACAVLMTFYLMDSGLPLRDVVLIKVEDLQFFWTVVRQMLVRGRRVVGQGSSAG